MNPTIPLSVRQESPAEKALHELDVYKTPLLPTRLRSNNPGSSRLISDSASTDLFKSRRKSNLVLMQDEERVSRLGRKPNVKRDAPLVNETKPYAGEGGMKKLLARRRMEAEKYEKNPNVFGTDDAEEKMHVRGVESHTSDARPTLNDTSAELHTSLDSTRPSSHPFSANKDWYSNASSSSTSASVSSLRVGRTKTRAHIVRPITRPMKTKFSAAYEDDDSMDDVEILQGESAKQLEREALDEAAKWAPVFNIPEGFCFPKEVSFCLFSLGFWLMFIRRIPWNTIHPTRKNRLSAPCPSRSQGQILQPPYCKQMTHRKRKRYIHRPRL